jgi:hypothetical protein
MYLSSETLVELGPVAAISLLMMAVLEAEVQAGSIELMEHVDRIIIWTDMIYVP